ncbi:helix-hairpin-helix domain-containing protein [Candidatus Cyanaurora vandensis]|uniref:helix-hairpin-helix domain-containing protein n=1 Tax=Candidatus Cyanaurora vandensis TaxID=2714958 RepID=UPI00257BB1AA|nr:helix-hairpin-helix domain-containing protein [Candidatus Cyanaurora vandensis]
MRRLSTPSWFYTAAIPGLGWLTLLVAGYRSRDRWAVSLALAYGAVGFLGVNLGLEGVFFSSWVAGIVHLALIKDDYTTRLQLAQPKTGIGTTQEAFLAQAAGLRVDINQATQDELVYRLNLSILQVNRILALRQAGMIFTSIEELAAQAAIPLTKLKVVEPILCFAYYDPETITAAWMQVNILTAAEISQQFNLDPDLSQRLVAERDVHGAFTSLVDLRQRVSLPYNEFHKLF